MDGYFTTLGGRILRPGREVSGLGLNGLLRGGAVGGGGKAEVPKNGEWQCTLSCCRCGTPGIGNLAYWGKGVLVVFRARGAVLGRELLGQLEFSGETKALSVSTRLGVGRPAVEKLASPQQAPGRFHEEAWAGL